MSAVSTAVRSTLVLVALLALTVGALRAGGVGDASPAIPGDPFERIAAEARALAAAPYRPEQAIQPPAALAKLTYDQYRDIRFRPERALWRERGLPFELMFFHLGKYQLQPVRVNSIDGHGGVDVVPFNSADFDYGNNELGEELLRSPLGFAGFRAHYALNSSDYLDELVVFLGASYFRALGAGQRYGLSARGLAIDTVGGDGEEFPASSSSGCNNRRPTRSRCRSTRCSIPPASPVPTPSTSARARRP